MSNEQNEVSGSADSQSEVVQVRHEGDVAVVTMNYPERRNAFSLKMRLSLIDVFRRLMNDESSTRAIVLTGAGGHFCAGGDISEMHAATPSLLELRERITIGVRLFRQIYTGTKPVVAAVDGSCYGAGVSLAAACDMVVSSRSAKYSCSFGKVGLLPDTGILWTLPQKVGAGKARELMLTGKVIDALAAQRAGLANNVVNSDEVLQVAIETAARFASYPPVTLALLKASLVNAGNSLEDACRLEVDLNPLTRQTHDHSEAVSAFMEKRKPVFTGT